MEAATIVPAGDVLLRIDEVERRTGLSRATIYRRIAAKLFPPACRLGEKCVRWRGSAIDDWIAKLPPAA